MNQRDVPSEDKTSEDWSNMGFVLKLAEAFANITCSNPDMIDGRSLFALQLVVKIVKPVNGKMILYF